MPAQEKKIPDSIKGLVDKIRKKFSMNSKGNEPEIGELIKELMDHDKELEESGIQLKDVLQMSDTQIEAIYAEGGRLYQTGKYRESGNLCYVLSVLNPREPKYYFRMANCLQMLKKYEEACTMYELYAALVPADPTPYFFSYECKKQLEQIPAAIQCLKWVVERGQGNAEYANLVENAKLRLVELENQFLSRSSNPPSKKI